MSIRKASARTTVNSGTNAATAATVNQITTAPATATVVAGGGTIGGAGVTISNVAITDSTFANVLSGDTAVGSSGGFVRITGTGFADNANVYFNSALIANTFVSSTQINANIPATTAGTYNFYVFNTDGSGANYTSGVTTSGFPTVTVTTYNIDPTSNTQITATGDAPLTFSIKAGSSNTGNFTVNSAGYIGATSVSDGAYTLTVIVDDAQSQSTQQDLTINVTSADPYFNLTTLLLSGDGSNNANNSVFTDSSDNNLTITRNGNTTQGTFTPFSQTGWSNYVDTAYQGFSGSGSLIGAAVTTFTAEGWIYMTAAPASGDGVPCLIGMDALPASSIYLGFGPNASRQLVLRWFDGASKTATGGTVLALNTWYHIAVVANANAIAMYVNGAAETLSGTTTLTNRNGTASSFALFHNSSVSAYQFKGYASSIRVTTTAVYTGAFTPSTAPLTAVTGTVLLTCQSNGIVDTNTQTTAKALTLIGGILVQAFSPFAPTINYSAAAVGGSGYFNGNGDWLSLASDASIALGTGDFTWESWVYIDSSTIPTTAGIYDQRNGTNGVSVVQPVVELTSGNGYSWYVAAANKISSTAAVVKPRSWQHLAVCRSSGVTKMFLDGVQVGSNYTDNNNYPAGSLTIARENDGVNTRYFTGYLSGLRVIKGTALYTSNFAIPTSPPTVIANTAMLLNFTNAGIFDATSKNVLETVADAKISTAQSKFGGSSIVFDGSGDYLNILGSPSFDFRTGDFTLEFWMYQLSSTGTQVILDAWNNAPTRFLVRTVGTALQFYATPSNTSYTLPALNTWYHVACVRNGSTFTLYVDGVSRGTFSSAATLTASTALWTISRGAESFNGYLSNIRITKGYAIYTANFTPPTAAFKLR